MAIKEWKKSQSGDGYYKKYQYGYKTLKFEYNPDNKIAGKWNLYYNDSGSGEGYLIDRFKTKPDAINGAKKYMRTH